MCTYIRALVKSITRYAFKTAVENFKEKSHLSFEAMYKHYISCNK